MNEKENRSYNLHLVIKMGVLFFIDMACVFPERSRISIIRGTGIRFPPNTNGGLGAHIRLTLFTKTGRTDRQIPLRHPNAIQV